MRAPEPRGDICDLLIGDELEFLERVFLLATITIEIDSITIKMRRSFLFL